MHMYKHTDIKNTHTGGSITTYRSVPLCRTLPCSTWNSLEREWFYSNHLSFKYTAVAHCLFRNVIMHSSVVSFATLHVLCLATVDPATHGKYLLSKQSPSSIRSPSSKCRLKVDFPQTWPLWQQLGNRASISKMRRSALHTCKKVTHVIFAIPTQITSTM